MLARETVSGTRKHINGRINENTKQLVTEFLVQKRERLLYVAPEKYCEENVSTERTNESGQEWAGLVRWGGVGSNQVFEYGLNVGVDGGDKRADFGKGTVTRKQINSTQATVASVLTSRGAAATEGLVLGKAKDQTASSHPSKTLLGEGSVARSVPAE